MANEVNTTPVATAGIESYRQAERALWDHYGLEPNEQFVDLASPAVHLRVLEIGSGEPVLFIPGSGGTGPYGARSFASCSLSAVSCSIDPVGA